MELPRFSTLDQLFAYADRDNAAYVDTIRDVMIQIAHSDGARKVTTWKQARERMKVMLDRMVEDEVLLEFVYKFRKQTVN